MVSFYNNANSAVSNWLHLSRVPSGTVYSAGLYYAPDGETNLSHFIMLGSPISFYAPGLFSGGFRTTPPTTPPGGFAMFQVRVWQSYAGATFEEGACASAPYGGWVGCSQVLRIQTGDLTVPNPPPPPSLVGAGLRGFYVAGPLAYYLRISDPTVVVGTNGTREAQFALILWSDPPNAIDPFFCGPVVLRYSTSNGTAVAGQDYVPTNAVISLRREDFQVGPPGPPDWFWPQKIISIPVLPNPGEDPDEEFYLDVSVIDGPVILEINGCPGTTYPCPDRGKATITGLYFTDIHQVGADVSLSFQTASNRYYRVERTSRLSPAASWTRVGTNALLGTGAIITLTDAGAATGSNVFYRVRTPP